MNDSLAKNTRTGIFWGVLQRSIHRAVSFVVFILLARLLDPRDFGLVAVARIVIDYCEMLTGQGLGLAVIQKKDLTTPFLNTAFTCTFVVGLLAALFVALASQPLAHLLDAPDAAPVLLALSVSIVIAGLTRIQMALLTKNFQFKKLAKLQIGVSLSSAAIGVGMALAGFGVWSLVAMQICTTFLTLILVWSASDWIPKLQFDVSSAKELYQFGWKVLIDHHIRFLAKKIDEIVILAVLGAQALGFYSVAKRFVGVISSIFMQVISTVFLSALSNMQEDKEKLKAFFMRSHNIGALVFSPLFVVGAILLGDFIPLAFGSKWLPAVDAAQIFMFSGVFMLSTNLIIAAYHSLGQPQVPMYMSLVDVTIRTPLMFYLASFGTTGVSVAVAVAAGIVACSYGLWLNKYIGMTYLDCYANFFKSLALCIPATLVMIATDMLLGQSFHPLIIMFASGVIGAFTYALTLLIFRVDVKPVLGMLKKTKL